MTQNILQSIWTIANKEMRIHFKTKRLLVIGIIFLAVFIIFSVWGGYLTGQDQDEPSYEEGAENVIIMVLAFSSFFPAILAIALTYDSIVGERVNNSIYLLISKPIKKEAVYLGKFLGAWLSIAMVYFGAMTVGYIIIIALSGQIPSALDVLMVYVAVLYILLGVAAWISLVMLLSTTFKTIASTLITAVLMWLFVLSLVSQAGYIYWIVTTPTDFETSVDISSGAIPGNQSVIIAQGFKLGQDPGFIKLTVKDQSGNPVGAILPGTAGSIDGIIVPPGIYSWEATNGLMGDARKIYERGTITIRANNNVTSRIFELDDDDCYNDYFFSFQDEYNLFYPGGNYTLSQNGNVVDSGSVDASRVLISDLAEGWYDFIFVYNKETIIGDNVYSYGEKKAQRSPFQIAPEGEPPGYVKFLMLVNPDNAISSYGYLLNDDYDGLLSLGESTAALVVFLAVCGTTGILLFKKKDLI